MRSLWMLLLAACVEEEPTELPTCASLGAPTQAYVVNVFRFARREAGVVRGFDLDDDDTTAGMDAGCGHADLTHPDGSLGIDNNFSALVPVLEATEASATEALIAQSIASGELLITFELADVDSWMGDDCIDFTLGRAQGVPLVGPDGVLLDHQTLARSTTVAPVHSIGTSGGRYITTGEMAFNLPLDILNAVLDFEVTQGRFTLQKRFDGAVTGVMGGVIPIAQITEILLRDDVMLQSFVPVVEATADMRGPSGTCDRLSLAFEVEAIPVFLE